MKDKTDIMVMNAKTVDLIWEPLSHFDTHDCWDYSIEFACIKGPEGKRFNELGQQYNIKRYNIYNIKRGYQQGLD